MVDKAVLKWALSGEDSDQAKEPGAYQGRPSLNILAETGIKILIMS